MCVGEYLGECNRRRTLFQPLYFYPKEFYVRNKLSTSRDAKGLIAFLDLKSPQTETGGGGDDGAAKVLRPSKQIQEPMDKAVDEILQMRREVCELRRSQDLMQDMVQQVKGMLSTLALIGHMMHRRK